MIKRLYNLFPNKSVLLRLTVIHVVRAILEGILLGILVPIVTCLLHPQPDFNSIKIWLIVGCIGFLFHLILTIIATPIGFGASLELAASLRNNVMNHVTQLPLGWFTPDKKNGLTRILTADISAIAQLAVAIGAPAITAILVPATIIIVSFFINWKIGILLLIIMLFALFVLRWSGNITAESAKKLEKAATKIAGKAIEFGQAQTVLRAAGKGVEGTTLLQKILAEHRIVYRRGLERSRLPDLSYTGVVMVGFVAVILSITFLFNNKSLSVSEAIVLFILAVRFLEPLAYLIELNGALRAMDNAISRVKELLQTSSLPMELHPITRIDNASIRLENVSFGYGETSVINDVSFYCPHGSTTALIGASGSGKTTLIRLIARFYDVNKGAIKIGETDIRKLDYNTMMNDISIVFQQVYLFDTSIKENLLIAKPDATETELKEAAKAAQLDEMLKRLPNGWDTKVGEGGLQLSGGERQRVSIARAFLKKTRIILIDEAASALDPENEQAISKAIANIAKTKNRTVIVIAHRPITLESADQVVVLSSGKVIEYGNPQDLLAKNLYYATFIRQYQSSREWLTDTNYKY